MYVLPIGIMEGMVPLALIADTEEATNPATLTPFTAKLAVCACELELT